LNSQGLFFSQHHTLGVLIIVLISLFDKSMRFRSKRCDLYPKFLCVAILLLICCWPSDQRIRRRRLLPVAVGQHTVQQSSHIAGCADKRGCQARLLEYTVYFLAFFVHFRISYIIVFQVLFNTVPTNPKIIHLFKKAESTLRPFLENSFLEKFLEK
jgi:hypothetical protein